MTDPKLPDDQEKLIFEIYQKAIDLDGDARSKYIDEATEEDNKLKDAVNDLVASSEQAEQKNFMHTPAVDLAQLDLSQNTSHPDPLSQENEEIPPPIGNYKPTKLVGEGGFGKVYLAEQSEPVSRKVALKLIRRELIDERFIKRFKAERQMLAVLNHPNIAQIYDAGATDEGRPFLVMEFVDGINLTDYCNQNKLGIRSRLRIFIQICNAIQHAHQKGVIHRDIKPANILVTEENGFPIPKVIDFGISKALDLKFNEKTVATMAEFFGSPSYMSPEQISQKELDIDTRADVYSLGILLYELLLGSPPFNNEQSLIVLMNQILSEEPLKPSKKAETLTKDVLSNLDNINLKKLKKTIDGDLDWIILKALDKERDNRYSSASDFANDIRRYLNDEPVTARAPTQSYRIRKFISRHIFGVASSAIIMIVLIAGIIGTTSGYRSATQQADTAQQTVNLLLEFLSAVDPSVKGRELKVIELLEAFKPKLEELNQRPRIQVSLMKTYAKTYFGLGLFPEANVFNERALTISEIISGTEHPDSLSLLIFKVKILRKLGEYKTAEKWGRKAVLQSSKSLGSEHLLTLQAASETADVLKELGKFLDAETLHRETLKKRQRILGNDHLDTVYSKARLAVALGYQNKMTEAIKLNREVLRSRTKLLGADHPLTLNTMNNLAFAIGESGDLLESEKLHRATYEQRLAVLGIDHPETLTSMANLAWILNEQGKYIDAEKIHRQTWEIEKRVLGIDHPDTLVTMGNLATTLMRLRNLDEAERLHRIVWEKRVLVLGKEHPATLAGLNDLAVDLARMKKYSQAKLLFQQLVESRTLVVGEEHPGTLTSMGNLAWVLTKLEDYEAAIRINRKTLAAKQSAMGEEHPSTLDTLNNLADSLLAFGHFKESAKTYQQSLEKRKRVLGHEHPKTNQSRVGLGKALIKLGKGNEAKEILEEALIIQIKLDGDEHRSIKKIKELIGKLSILEFKE